MSKKITAMALALSMILGGTLVFANDTSAANIRTRAEQKVEQKVQQKVQNIENNLAEIKPLINTIRNNKTLMLKLRAEARIAYQAAKNKVKQLYKDKDTLTPEKIEELKQALSTLNKDVSLIGGTIGDIQKKSLNLRLAKRNNDLDGYKQALNNIISIQNERINNLKMMISDMNKIANM